MNGGDSDLIDSAPPSDGAHPADVGRPALAVEERPAPGERERDTHRQKTLALYQEEDHI